MCPVHHLTTLGGTMKKRILAAAILVLILCALPAQAEPISPTSWWTSIQHWVTDWVSWAVPGTQDGLVSAAAEAEEEEDSSPSTTTTSSTNPPEPDPGGEGRGGIDPTG